MFESFRLLWIAASVPVLLGAAADAHGAPPATLEHAQSAAPNPSQGILPRIDRVLVIKHLRRLYLLAGSETVAAFPIKLGRHPRGPKIKAGDGKTPEGEYVLDWRNSLSLFTLAIHISYPSRADRERAQRLHVDPGGAIEIHGEPFVRGAISAAKLQTDWTAGCIALSNADMQRVWDIVADGTLVEIKP